MAASLRQCGATSHVTIRRAAWRRTVASTDMHWDFRLGRAADADAGTMGDSPGQEGNASKCERRWPARVGTLHRPCCRECASISWCTRWWL